ncbi:MAG TPA: hypothetical protein VGN14_17760 [Candidatus Elarobacter sp.]
MSVRTAVVGFATLLALSTAATPASARIGGVASRGDNCTPINAFAVGYPLAGEPQPSTIVDQRVVLDRGWRTIGFFLISQSGGVWFAPFNVAASHEEGSYNVPTLFPAQSMAPAQIITWYPRIRRKALVDHMAGPGDFVDHLQSVTVSPCYVKALRP